MAEPYKQGEDPEAVRKYREKGQESVPEGRNRERKLSPCIRNVKERSPKSTSSNVGSRTGQSSMDGKPNSKKVNSQRRIQRQELTAAAEHYSEETAKASTDMNDKKMKKKKKKKRDRWGQVLDDADGTHNSSNDGIEGGMLDDAGNAAYEDADVEHDSLQSEYDSKTVCAGGMPYDTTEEDILECFMKCGTIARVLCMKFADTQRFKGLAFITFETETAASKALSLDGVNMGGRHIKVEKAREGGKVLRDPPRREAGSLSVYVGNLDWGVQKIDIKRFFKGCDIDNVRLAVDKYTSDFRGYGHVDFSDEQSLEKAIKMDQKQLLGRPVKVCYAVPKGFKGKSG